MENLQDLIKPLPPAPGGKSTSRGSTDTTRKTEGGADFAEAMRSARDASQPEAREARGLEARESNTPDARETRAPDATPRAPRETPDEASDEPVYASSDADAAQDVPSAADTPNRTDTDASLAAAGLPMGAAPAPLAANTGAAPIQTDTPASSAIAGLSSAPASSAPLPTVADYAIDNSELTRVAASDTAPRTDTSFADALARAGSPDAAESAAPVLLAQAPTAGAPTVPAAELKTTDVANLASPPVQAAAPAVELAKAMPAASQEVASTDPQVAVAPTPVALKVDRAIGNAIVNMPSTGTFKAAEIAAATTPDPARIASQGFVAIALQPPAETGAPTLATTSEGDASLADASPWLEVRPDSLATALADRAMTKDGASQLPPKLDQMIQSLDAKIATIAGAPSAPGSIAGADSKLPAAAMTANGPTATALQIQANNTQAENAPEPVRLSLSAPLQQSSRWATELGDRLAWVANNRLSSATLQVNPPQLGPIEVRITMSGDQAAVSFAAVQPQTRDAIQQALPVLASSFASQGLSLGQTSVGHEHTAQQGGQGGSGNGSGGGDQGGMLTAAASVESAGAASRATRGGDGLVDTFA